MTITQQERPRTPPGAGLVALGADLRPTPRGFKLIHLYTFCRNGEYVNLVSNPVGGGPEGAHLSRITSILAHKKGVGRSSSPRLGA
jgi:hypothetical protein